MRGAIHGIATAVAGAALALVIGATLWAAVAEGRPLATSTPTCHGDPAQVRMQADGSGVRAGVVNVHCPGSWRAFQGVMWYSDSATQYGKWTYGGTRYVTGHGPFTIKPWLRPYYGCGWWKQRIVIAGNTRDSAVSWGCSRRV